MPKLTSKNPPSCRSPEEYSSSTGEFLGSNKKNHGSHLSGNAIAYEEAWVKTSDGENIHIWFLFHPNSQQYPTLVYFHGNAGNMGYRLRNAAKMFSLTGINVLMMDYR